MGGISEEYESTPFLRETEARCQRGESKSFLQRHKYSICVHTLLISIYTLVSLMVVQSLTAFNHETTALKPIRDLSIQYQPQYYLSLNQSAYSGPPTPESDQAWHDLFQDIFIRVDKEELDRNHQTSVALPNGGYMVWTGAHHQMHCLKMLRRWTYRDHYYPNITAADYAHWNIHADHCIEYLRSAALCHGDTTLTTFKWDQDKLPTLNLQPVPHKCVDWTALTDSLKHRVVPQEERNQMVNPNLIPPSDLSLPS